MANQVTQVKLQTIPDNITVITPEFHSEDSDGCTVTFKCMGDDVNACNNYILDPQRRHDAIQIAKQNSIIRPGLKTFTVFPMPLDKDGEIIRSFSVNPAEIAGQSITYNVIAEPSGM